MSVDAAHQRYMENPSRCPLAYYSALYKRGAMGFKNKTFVYHISRRLPFHCEKKNIEDKKSTLQYIFTHILFNSAEVGFSKVSNQASRKARKEGRI